MVSKILLCILSVCSDEIFAVRVGIFMILSLGSTVKYLSACITCSFKNVKLNILEEFLPDVSVSVVVE